MEKIVKKIVLTGGPSAGKSSSLELIKNYLTDLGYIVYIVNEVATELINCGIKPFGDNKISMIEFQEVLLKYQLFKENLISENIKKDKNVVIIYDRGILDHKAYICESEFLKLINKFNLEEKDLYSRYDLVLCLETGAKSNFYRTDNNNARHESIEEAILLDDKTYDSWKNAKNVFKIKCYDNFSDKQDEIIRIINNYILDKNC